MIKLGWQQQGRWLSTNVSVHNLIYCLAMGLLMFFSAPAQQAVTQENSDLAQVVATSFDSNSSVEARLHESAIPVPQRSIAGTLVGVGLVGFVVANCKRRKQCSRG
jgi:hypothetical protein